MLGTARPLNTARLGMSKPRTRPLQVLFEDEEIVVVDKPAGMIVHPAPGHEFGSMTEELVRRYPEMRGVGSESRPGVVHRLDQDTSGVMVFARTQAAYLDLRRQFESHTTISKAYLAVCHGAPKPAKGTVDSLIGREHLRAISHYEVLGRAGALALVKFDIETGRMHQIRIHAAELKHPIVGDKLYGNRAADRQLKSRPTRTLLHAARLSFLHPVTHKRVTFSAPPPEDIVYARA